MTEQKLIERIWAEAAKTPQSNGLSGKALKLSNGLYAYADGYRAYCTPTLYGEELTDRPGLTKVIADTLDCPTYPLTDPAPDEKTLVAYRKATKNNTWLMYESALGGIQIRYLLDALRYFRNTRVSLIETGKLNCFYFADDDYRHEMIVWPCYVAGSLDEAQKEFLLANRKED